MKKLIKVVLGFIVMSVLFTSCGAESDVLSQFSKRKYLKKSKANKHYELAVAEELVVNENKSELEPNAVAVENQSIEIMDREEVIFHANNKINTKEKVSEEILVESGLKDWSAYNREFVQNNTLAFKGVDNSKINLNQVGYSGQVNEVVIGILCIFLPPLAVYLYEDSITTNFWIDLVATLLFWIPGIVVAFLICFGGVSF